MPTRAELLAGADAKSKETQQAAKEGGLLDKVLASFDAQNQTLAKGLDSQEDFGKLLEIVSPTGVGTLIGKGAKTWNATSAELASKLEELGASAETIWKNTGTYTGPIDKMLRQEVPDMEAALKAFKPKEGQAAVKLGDMLEHKKLFEAYPELAELPVFPSNKFAFASNADGRKAMKVDATMLKKEPDKFLNIVLHEVQHAVQNIEGFVKGSSPEKAMATTEYKALTKGIDPAYFDDKANLDNTLRRMATRIYSKVGGEAEARAVQARQYYDPAELKNMLPTNEGPGGYDVALHALIKAPK